MTSPVVVGENAVIAEAKAKVGLARRRQLAAVLRRELARHFVAKRGYWIYLLALAPVVLVWAHSLHELARNRPSRHPLATDVRVMAGLFQVFILRLEVFFGCVGIFTYLFRGETLERTLHYYLLSPMRRELLVVGKYLAGLTTASFFFGLSTLLTFVGIFAHFPSAEVRAFLVEGPGLWQLGAYLGVTLLGCIGYGAVFLLMGLLFRNPVVPAIVVLVWESLNLFLPAWLRRISVIHWLTALCPVEVPPRGPGALLAVAVEPPPGWLAVLGVLGVAAAALVLAMRRARRLEVDYSD